jgi:hypothetical protein
MHTLAQLRSGKLQGIKRLTLAESLTVLSLRDIRAGRYFEILI